ALLHAKRLFGPTMDTGRDPSSPAVLATRGSTVTGPRLPERRRRRSGKSTPIRVSQLPIPSDTRVGVRGRRSATLTRLASLGTLSRDAGEGFSLNTRYAAARPSLRRRR